MYKIKKYLQFYCPPFCALNLDDNYLRNVKNNSRKQVYPMAYGLYLYKLVYGRFGIWKSTKKKKSDLVFLTKFTTDFIWIIRPLPEQNFYKKFNFKSVIKYIHESIRLQIFFFRNWGVEKQMGTSAETVKKMQQSTFIHQCTETKTCIIILNYPISPETLY